MSKAVLTLLQMWLNVQDAQKYATGTIPSSELDNYNTMTVPGDYIPNIWQSFNSEYDIVVNPSSDFSSHLGLVSAAQVPFIFATVIMLTFYRKIHLKHREGLC